MTPIRTADDFRSLLDAPVAVLTFWSAECAPFALLRPTLEVLSANNPTLPMGLADVRENRALARAFKVQQVPTVVVFKDKSVFKVVVGPQPLAKLQCLVNLSKSYA